MTRSKLTAALDAVDRGWHVFPLAAGRKVPAGGLTDWETRASADPETVARWWRRHPARNVAVAAGPSGLVVVDLDVRKPGQAPPAGRADLDGVASGADVLVALAEAHGQSLPPATYTVRTASGGWHLYFRAPAGAELRNTSGRIGWLIDTRAVGGYVVAAGSSVDGRAYRLVRDRAELPELPAWITALSAPPPAPVPTTLTTAPVPGPGGRVERYAAVALAGEIHRAATAPEGERHWQLNKAAFNLARHVAAGRLARATVERELQAAGEAAGRSAREVAATIRCGLDAGLRRHGGVA